jgi:hypothetical protein
VHACDAQSSIIVSVTFREIGKSVVLVVDVVVGVVLVLGDEPLTVDVVEAAVVVVGKHSAGPPQRAMTP